MQQKQPTFSIVIPTHNRPTQLGFLLRSFMRLDYPRDYFEVVVVDDGGEHPLDETVAPFKDQYHIVLLRQSRAGPANARQAGIEVAAGRMLAFTDDDCHLAADWLKIAAASLHEAPDCAVGGRTVNGLHDNVYSTASQMLISYLYTHYNADPGRARFFTTNNVVFPAERFRSMGGLNTAWSISGGEDRDLCNRWLRHGYGMIYAPDMVMYHAHALTLRTFWRQHFNYGRGAYHFHYGWACRQRGREEQERVNLEPPSFYWKLPCFAFSRTSRRRAPLIASLLVVAQLANAAGFLQERLKQDKRDVDAVTAHG